VGLFENAQRPVAQQPHGRTLDPPPDAISQKGGYKVPFWKALFNPSLVVAVAGQEELCGERSAGAKFGREV
jgi:hypothetical protein